MFSVEERDVVRQRLLHLAEEALAMVGASWLRPLLAELVTTDSVSTSRPAHRPVGSAQPGQP
ncbi:hypothetical protein ONA91_27230 [Micromonospora sp. DR5-3]|uniref:hypothetical protein n=1 Tax=unclassified Micromonospora TaxID=2617518 RepID=UPI0011DA4276|nr:MULTISPECIES: hypothetical protein [unclassified Micromonospora]MCW3818148.1 hypothetical protein [Micromonospora sp. DR5-3]TYC21345.1 hypothetical protein FXF52_26255 [Micromonospora sp. MP36]